MDILKKAEAIKLRAQYLESKYGYDKYTAYVIASKEIIKAKREDEQ